MVPAQYRLKQLLAPQNGRRSFDDVVRAGVYLTSMGDFITMNGIYAKCPHDDRRGVAAAWACVEMDLAVKLSLNLRVKT
jgi:enamine deaminase RidA (YjgF/YER057c/UK114 family)